MIVIDLTSVEAAKREEVLTMIRGRLSNFGRYQDEEQGIDLPIEVDSAAKIGYREEQKSLDDYRRELDGELKNVKKSDR